MPKREAGGELRSWLMTNKEAHMSLTYTQACAIPASPGCRGPVPTFNLSTSPHP